MDSQQVELIGSALFEAELIRQGFEVAKPRRGLGVSLFRPSPSLPRASLFDLLRQAAADAR